MIIFFLQVDSAEVLNLKCSDLYLYESILRPDQFGSLAHLRHLSLESCKVRQVPDGTFLGLRRLTSLSLRGHNSAWSGAMTMQLSADSLLGLDQVTDLDLSDNNVWGLPVGTLCHTQQLTALNLSHNNIVEVSEIGLTDNLNSGASSSSSSSVNNRNDNNAVGRVGGCQLLHLHTLDLSYNRISSFLPRDLSLAPGLRHLILRGNRLSVLSDQSLTGLWSLTGLDLADNQLSALPPALFHQASHLERLLLQNNSLSAASLSADVFHGLDNLLLLNLSRNGLVSQGLSEDTFSGLQKLMALDLSHNRLTHLPDGLLRAQNGLQILNLQHNKLTALTPDGLSSLVNLHIFLASHNRLDRIEAGAFDAMASLSSLSLDHNRLRSLPQGVLTSAMSASLNDLALNSNQLDRIPEDIGRLDRLRTLDLGENRIEKLEADSVGDNNNFGVLANITGLYGLRLAGNRLTRIGSHALANNANLHVLNLAHNRLEQIDTAALRNLTNLRALRLDNNRLADINGLVSGAKQLKWLNVSANRLAWFDFAFVPKSLEWLDIHDNAVDRIGNYYKLDGESGFELRTFDASHNQIVELGGPEVLALSSLRNIYLNNNRIRSIRPETFSRLGNLSRVELHGNQLVRMEMAALAVTNKGN